MSPHSRYRHSGISTHRLRYFVLLATRRRRELFASEEVRERVGELLGEAAERWGCEVLGVDVGENWACVHVDAPPDVAPNQIARRLREESARGLVAEFEEPAKLAAQKESVWTRRYLTSTEPISERVCAAFVAEQPSR